MEEENLPKLSQTNPRGRRMAAISPSRGEVLSLFRSLLRVATGFKDYNIREYARKRTIDGFQQNRDLSDPSTISAAFFDGKSQLEVARRQVMVYSLYAPKVKSVMEIVPPTITPKMRVG